MEEQEENVLGVVERLAGSRDPKDFIPHERIKKVVGEVAPQFLGEFANIPRNLRRVFVQDNSQGYRLVCPKDFNMDVWLVLENLGGGEQLRKVNSEVYNNLYDETHVALDRGRFGILKFPFTQLIQNKFKDEDELRKVLEGFKTDAPYDYKYSPLRKEAAFADLRNVSSFNINSHDLLSNHKNFPRIWSFVKSFQSDDSYIQKAFWVEPIIAAGQKENFRIVESRNRSMALRVLGVPLVPVFFE